MAAVFYGSFRVAPLDQHGTRVDRLPAGTRLPPFRRRDFAAPQRHESGLIGRSALLGDLARAAGPGRAVELRGPCGFGKSSLLAVLADRLAASKSFPVTTVRVGALPPDDVLDQVFGALYTAGGPLKPSREQRNGLLARARAVIVLDDVSLEPDQIARILAALPRCLVLIAAERPLVGAKGLSVELAGLDEEAGLQLLARDLGRPLENADHHDAARLCAAVQGQPLRLRQAAALVAGGRVSMRSLTERAVGDARVLDRLTADALGDSERRVLGVLALAAGTMLPGDLVEVLCALADITEDLGKLRRRGLVEQQWDRFGLPRCLGQSYRKLLLGNLRVGASVEPLVTWLGQRDPTSSDALAGANAAIEVLAVLGERAEWDELVRLAEVTSRVLTLANRWETSRQVLEQGLEAARQVGNMRAQARFHHDLGSLQLCSGDPRQAQSELRQALELRRQHGDNEDAALTQHNLDLLSPQSAPLVRLTERLKKWTQPIRRRVPTFLSLASAATLIVVILLRTLAFPTTTTTTTTAAGTTTPSPTPTIVHPTAPTTVPSVPSSTPPPRPSSSTSTRQPGLIAAPDSIAFPAIPVGGSSAQKLRVASTGTAPLRLGDFEVEGDRADFTADQRCRHVLLRPGRSCEITVTFRPSVQGSRTARLVIHQNLPGALTQVQLAGTGVLGAARQVTVTVEVQAGTDLRVTSQPPGIDCPAACQATFPTGTTITLQAITKSGPVVWERDCAGAVNTCTLRLDTDRQVLVGLAPLPDLIPSGPRRSLDGTQLVVTVTNQGEGDAAPSTTDVLFGTYGSASLATPALAAGKSTDVSTAIPGLCFDPDCDFTVVVDAHGQLRESDEDNNSLSDTFLG